MEIFPNFLPINPLVDAFISEQHCHYIGGQWVPPSTDEYFTTYNPSTGQPLGKIPEGSVADVDHAVRKAREAFHSGAWLHKLTGAERGQLLWKLADLIDEHREILAQLDSLDNGKPVTTTKDVDIPLSVDHIRYYAGWADKIEGSTIPVNAPNMFNYTIREPIGVCGLIVPWNYPLLMAVWKIAPALAAGNCIILKPAEQTSLSALYLSKLFDEAGFPSGVFNVVTGHGEITGAAMTEHDGIDKISFTGSTEVARKILRASTGNLKRVSLELGGKSPNIVFADAELERAIVGSTWAIFGNNGQSCTAGSRLYIEASIFDQVVDGMAREVQNIQVGPGMSVQQPHLGPVISNEQLNRVLSYVEDGYAGGGTAVAGGHRIAGELQDGYFIEPTIFVDVNDSMKLVREEIFGPVVCAMPFEDIDDIVRRANDTDYGLAAGIWTTDVRKAHNISAQLKAGTIWVNTWGNTEAASPFGGYKQSGNGREMGKNAIDLYTETKSIWIDLS